MTKERNDQVKQRPPKEPMTYAPIRLSAKCLEKLQRMREVETRKQMYPVTRADVMRTCIALGLAAWEKQTAAERSSI